MRGLRRDRMSATVVLDPRLEALVDPAATAREDRRWLHLHRGAALEPQGPAPHLQRRPRRHHVPLDRGRRPAKLPQAEPGRQRQHLRPERQPRHLRAPGPPPLAHLPRRPRRDRRQTTIRARSSTAPTTSSAPQTATSTSPTRRTASASQTARSRRAKFPSMASTASAASDGSLTLLVDDFERPNGIVISNDGRQLLIDDTDRHHVRVFDLGADGSSATAASSPTSRTAAPSAARTA